MSIDQETRDRLRHLTHDVVGGPDLTVTLREGRRLRRRRTTRVGVAALAVAGLGLGTAWQLLSGASPGTAVDPSTTTSQPAYHDFVPGTDVDETLQATVAEHLPGIAPATRIYASDWNHDGPLPDDQVQNATDWEMFYDVTGTDMLAISISKKIPGGLAQDECDDLPVEPGQPACEVSTLSDGSTLVTDSIDLTSTHLTGYWFRSTLTLPDGSVLTANQKVTADSWAQAMQRCVYDSGQTSGLIEDPAMTFPDPVVTPPPPAHPR